MGCVKIPPRLDQPCSRTFFFYHLSVCQLLQVQKVYCRHTPTALYHAWPLLFSLWSLWCLSPQSGNTMRIIVLIPSRTVCVQVYLFAMKLVAARSHVAIHDQIPPPSNAQCIFFTTCRYNDGDDTSMTPINPSGFPLRPPVADRRVSFLPSHHIHFFATQSPVRQLRLGMPVTASRTKLC